MAILPELVAGDSGNVNYWRVRNNVLQIFTDRFTEDVEDNYFLSIEYPVGTEIAGLYNFGNAYNTNQSRYNINNNNFFVIGTRASLTAAIRAGSADDFTRLNLFRPIPRRIGATGVIGGSVSQVSTTEKITPAFIEASLVAGGSISQVSDVARNVPAT